MKDKKFSVFTTQTFDGKSTYVHWSEGLNMYITKDGKTIKLTSEEVEELVKALPRTIGGNY